MKTRVAIGVLLVSVLVGLSTLGIGPTQAEPNSRAAKGTSRSPKVASPTLAFEGKAQVSLEILDNGESYLSFLPQDVDAGYGIALPVDRGAGADQAGAAVTEPWKLLSGSVVLRFNRGVTALDVSVTAEDGAVTQRVFTLNHKDKTPAEFLRVSEAFIEFMNTGTYPLFAEIEAEFAAVAAREENSVVADAPVVSERPSCSCSSASCNCSVGCGPGAISATCACGSTCSCSCVYMAA